LIASIADGRLNQGIESMMRVCREENAHGVVLISGELRWDELDHLCVADTINGVPVWRPTGWTTESVQGALFNIQRYGVLTYLDMGQHAHVGKALQRIANKLPHFGEPTIHFSEFDAPFGYSRDDEIRMAFLAQMPGIGAVRAVNLVDHLALKWSVGTPFYTLLLMLANQRDALPEGIGVGTCNKVREFLELREGEKLYAMTIDYQTQVEAWDAKFREQTQTISHLKEQIEMDKGYTKYLQSKKTKKQQGDKRNGNKGKKHSQSKTARRVAYHRTAGHRKIAARAPKRLAAKRRHD
jgi:hypothetical protein